MLAELDRIHRTTQPRRGVIHTAQGNAPDKRQNIQALKGRNTIGSMQPFHVYLFITPFQGLASNLSDFPGRCPGL